MAQAASAQDLPAGTRAARRHPLLLWLKRAGLGLGGLALCGAGLLLLPRPLPPGPTPHAPPAAESFMSYVDRRKAQAQAEGVRPGNEERLVWASPQVPEQRAPIAILYVHGFGASRAEGEAVVEPLAQALHATVYYTRLPGHGGDLERHAAARPEQYFAVLEEDFHRLRPLANKLILIGSSTGGLLTTWLAARHPEEVDALVLASPLFELSAQGTFLLSRRLGLPLVQAILGEYRDAGWKRDPQGRKQPGYEDFWITRQKMSTVGVVEDIRRQAMREADPADISAPILLLYYYADAQHQDEVCSVAAMQSFIAKTHHGAPHPLTRSVAITDGNHILLSRYVRTDKATISRELQQFLGAVLGAEPSGGERR